MKIINDFMNKLGKSSLFTKVELTRLRKDVEFSEKIHHGERRADGSPYIIHVLAVVEILIFEMGIYDTNCISAAIFHDNAENSGRPRFGLFAQMEKLENSDVATLVFFLSKHQNPTVRKKYYEILAFIGLMRVLLIKLADRIHNLRTIEFVKRKDRIRKINETISHFFEYLIILKKELPNAPILVSHLKNPNTLVIKCEELLIKALCGALKKINLP